MSHHGHDEVEGHLLKEAAATAAVAGAMFAGQAQAKFTEPDPGNQARPTHSQKASQPATPAKKAVKPHARQRNRADNLDSP